jgi:virginiamycin B lyase
LALVERDGALWFSQAGGGRIGRIAPDGRFSEFPIPSPDSQPRAIAIHPNGTIWFVETSSNALGRVDRDGAIHEFVVPIDHASLRGVIAGPDGNLWFTANGANQIGAMTPDGSFLGAWNVPTANAGPRCIMAHSNGRLYFGCYDSGAIGEILLSP